MSRYVFKIMVGCALFAAAILYTIHGATADQIRLKLKDGNFMLQGKLVKYTGAYYVVNSLELGVITVDAKKFMCISQNCPRKTVPKRSATIKKQIITNNFGIHGSNTIGAKLMPALIYGQAKDSGLKTKKIIGARSEEINILLSKKDGANFSNIELHSHGSGTSFPGLVSGAAQIGMSSRPIKPKEQKAMASAGISNMKSFRHEHILALDGLIVIVSKSNSIASLSMKEIAEIFSGKISDWSQLGRVKPGKINVYARDVKSGTFDTFNSLVLKANKVKISSSAQRFESNSDLSDKVANDPNGIGFTGFAYKRNSKALAISSSCGIIKKPTLFNVKTEEYPLARRLFLYTTPSLSSPYAKKLLRYSLSNKAQRVITSVGFVNQTIDKQSFSEQGNHLAAALTVPNEETDIGLIKEFVKDFVGAERLSVTFRFKHGSIDLSNKSRTDVKRLVRLMQSKELKDKKVFLVGFSSARGTFDLNRELAFKRALRIKSALISQSSGKIQGEKLNIRSYGELFPVRCNSTASGSRKNQRVEVWIK